MTRVPAPVRSRRAKSAGPLAAAALALGLAACLQAGAPAAAEPARAQPLTHAPDGRPLRLTFDDEFDSFRRWSHGHGVWRTTFRDDSDTDEYNARTLASNKELELYVDPDMRPHPGRHSQAEGAGEHWDKGGAPLGLNPFRLHDGVLDLVAQPAPPALQARIGGFRYTSGLITTQPSFHQTYGYFEMRARLPRGKGVWPAFWLLPADLSWPPEIDVMESIGDPGTIWGTAHSKVDNTPGTKVSISPAGFHVFAVSWDPHELIWYVDGREVKRQPTPADMNKPMYMLANVALGGDWAGAPDASTPFPARMSIDYIRAYRFTR